MTGDLFGKAPKARQLVLDLERLPDYAGENFVTGPANFEAFALIQAWPDWTHRVAMLHGAVACGKSHLAHMWAERAGAVLFDAGNIAQALTPLVLEDRDGQACLVEDIDRARLDEDGLFHLINHLTETGGYLLLTARTPWSGFHIKLPDLASRLRSANTVEIGHPDSEMLQRLLVKLFADRQVELFPRVTDFAVGRMERSFASALALVNTVDRMALEQGRRVTIPLLRAYFDNRQAAGGGSIP